MKKKDTDELLKKYLEGKTSEQEEQLLRDHSDDSYFLEEIRFYDKSNKKKLSDSFDERIKKSIGSVDKKLHINTGVLFRVAAVFLLIFITVLLIQMNASYQQMSARMDTMQSALAITLMDQQSVHVKLKALELVGGLPAMQTELSTSLMELLNTDDNVNVRMAAIETMAGFPKDELVKKELIKSLGRQESFLVRAILVESLIKMNDPVILEELKRMIDDDRTELELKNQIKEILL